MAAAVGTRVLYDNTVFMKTAEDGWSLYGEETRRVTDGHPYDKGIPALESLASGDEEYAAQGRVLGQAPPVGTVVEDQGALWTRGEGEWTVTFTGANAGEPDQTYRENYQPTDSTEVFQYMIAGPLLDVVERAAAGEEIEGLTVKFPEAVK